MQPSPPPNPVIFMHPHIGVEDARAHSSFLAHFFRSAAPLLEPMGAIHVALTTGQAERWEAARQARRVGLFVIEVQPLETAALERAGYQLRRTARRGTFRSVAGGSVVLTLARTPAAKARWSDVMLWGKGKVK